MISEKAILDKVVDLIWFGFEDNFIAARTGAKEYQICYIREMIEEEEEEEEEDKNVL